VGDRHAGLVSNVRGRGLMCAIDLPDRALRDDVITRMREIQVLILACGERTIRFRPALNVTTDELKAGVRALDDVLGGLAAAARGR
jgi:L-lysine 6-transaminase